MNIRRFWQTSVAALLLAASAAGCSSDEGSIYDYVSAEEAVVSSISLSSIAGNAGFEVGSDGSVKPSEEFASIVAGSDAEWLLQAAQIQGVDLEKAIASYQQPTHRKAIVLAITDKGDLEKYLADNSFTGEGEGVYSHDELSFVIDGSYGVMLDIEAAKASDAVAEMKEAAKKAPLAQWQKELLNSNATVSAICSSEVAQKVADDQIPETKGLPGFNSKKSDEEKASTDYIALTCNLSGAAFDSSIAFYSADGKPVKSTPDFYKADTSLLQYATADDAIVTLMGMPKDLDYASLVAMFIDGTGERMVANKMLKSMRSIMLAAGPLPGASADDLTAWNGVVAIEFAPSKANEFFSLLRMVARKKGGPTAKVSDKEISLIYEGLPILAKCEGNTIMVSVNPTPDDARPTIVKPGTFDGDAMGVVVDFAQASAIAKALDVPFGVESSLLIAGSGVNLDITLTGANGKFLETIIGLIAANNQE